MSLLQKIPFLKPPLTFADQVSKLQGHGLIIHDTARAEFYLGQLNYYRLAAYCLPFQVNPHSHKLIEGTTFEDVLNLYVFDRELRLLMLDAIERIEVSLRTQLAYHLSHLHKTAHPHLDEAIFYNKQRYAESLKRLKDDAAGSKEDFIKHHFNKYQEDLPPIWAIVELMTMGQLSKWFQNIRSRTDKNAICRVYGLDEKIMTSLCLLFSVVRNFSAHHARLWNRDFAITPTLPKQGHPDLLGSLFVVEESDRRKRKLYNTFTFIIYLLGIIAPDNQWKARLLNLIKTHQIDTVNMGFPSDWADRPLWISK